MQISSINQQQQQTFGSNILISAKTFQNLDNLQRLQSLGRSIEQPWTIAQSITASSGYTSHASKCIVGLIKAKNADKWFMFHLQPCFAIKKPSNYNKDYLDSSIELYPEIIKTISDVIEQFKINNKKVSGVLIGGNNSSQSSNFLLKKLVQIFKRNKIDYSELVNQPTLEDFYGRPVFPSCDIYFNAKKDKIIISPPKINTNAKIPPEELQHLKTPFARTQTANNDFLQIMP